MNKVIMIFSILLIACIAQAKQTKVMIVDTGYDFKSKWQSYDSPKLKLCKSGHKDFTGTGIHDNNGHGTHIAGLIGKYADNSNYCVVIVKFFDEKSSKNANTTIDSFKYAIEQNVDIINYSAGGKQFMYEECEIVKKALDKGIIIVAAAGNNGSDLNLKKYYPAMCDPRVLKISNLDSSKRTIAETSNYSDDTILVSGTDLISTTPNDTLSIKSGTSQATAVYTGKLIKTLQILNNRKGF